jgi:FkbH-like protein/thioester reductase-like protein
MFPVTVDARRLHLVAESSPRAGEALHIGGGVTLRGPLDPDALREALRALTRAHAALRLGFVVDAGTTYARTDDACAVILDHTEGRAVDDVGRALGELMHQPFDLEKPPLWRFRHVRLGPDLHVVLVVTHHLVADYRSLSIILRDLQRLLRKAPLLPEPIAYDQAIRNLVASQRDADSAARWTDRLEGTRALRLELEGPRPLVQSYRASTHAFRIDAALRARLEALATTLGLPLAALLLASFEIVLAKLAGETRFVVGVPVDGRHAARSPRAVGFFTAPVPVRAEVDGSDSLTDVARKCYRELVALSAHGGSFAASAPALRRAHGRAPGRPLLQALFSFVANDGEADALSHVPWVRPRIDLDVSLTLRSERTEIAGFLDCNEDAFGQQWPSLFGRALIARLEADPNVATEAWSLPAELVAAVERRSSLRSAIGVASSFTDDLVRELVTALVGVAHLPHTLVHAPYGQVLPSLLAPGGPLGARGNALNFVLVRGGDPFHHAVAPPSRAAVEGWASELSEAVGRRAAETQVPHLVAVLPEKDADDTFAAAVAARLSGAPLVDVLTPEVFARAAARGGVPKERWFDATADAAAHAPFTPELSAVIASELARRLYTRARPPVKVVAVDGDNTLWGGVVGEVGASGVTLGGDFARVHQRLLHLRSQGALLVLVSKNDPESVREVLARSDSALKANHFAVIHASWDLKSAALEDAARTLGLALDAFVFLDDNPVEIAEVRARLPEVLALQVPAVGAIGRFLECAWPLQLEAKTDEDAVRADRYQEERARRSSQDASADYASFLASLDVRVEFAALGSENVARAVQLTQRTTQWNLLPGAVDAGTLLARAAVPGAFAAIVRVSDRFGDYGQVGLCTGRVERDALDVESLLLSCRVLGRGVEERLLAWLAEAAEIRGAAGIRLRAARTTRNLPARRFVASLANLSEEAEALDALVTLDVARAFRGSQAPASDEVEVAPVRRRDLDRRAEGERIEYLGVQLAEPRAILAALSSTHAAPPIGPRASPPSDALALRIATIMGEVLDTGTPDVDEDLFALGGGSLEALTLLSRLEQELDIRASFDALLAAPSPRAIAALAGSRDGAESDPRRALAEIVADDLALDTTRVPFRPRTTHPAASEPRNVLLTGATGFVGTYLLAELLRSTDARIVCLVRAKDAAGARARLRESFVARELSWSREIERRVEAVAGELGAPRLGLDEAAWEALAERVDAIYHLAAEVDFVAPYQRLRGPNVTALAALLELAARGAPKRVHHVSTMGVFHERSVDPHRPAYREHDPLPSVLALPSGYQQTKWVAEALCTRAKERGLDVTVYRIRSAGPHSRTGVFNPADVGAMILRTGLRRGVLPHTGPIDVAPVDFLCRALVTISLAPGTIGGIFHLAHPQPFEGGPQNRLFALAGRGFRREPLAVWLAQAARDLEADPSHPASAFAPLLRSEHGRTLVESTLAGPPTDMRETLAVLEPRGVTAPAFDASMLSVWVARFEKDDAAFLSARTNQLAPYMQYQERFFGYASAPEAGLAEGEAVHHVHRFQRAFERGRLNGGRLDMRLVAHAAGLEDVVKRGEWSLQGEVDCSPLDPRPLRVLEGRWRVRPLRGVSLTEALESEFARYEMELEAKDGRRYRLRGVKTIRVGLDVWSQCRTMDVEIREGENVVLLGRAVVPATSYVEDQVRSVVFRPGVPARERHVVVTAWLAYLSVNLGASWVDVVQRLVAEWGGT